MEHQETNVPMAEKDTLPPADPETPRMISEAPSEAVSEKQQHNQTGEEKGVSADEMGQNETTTQRNGGVRGHRKAIGNNSKVHQRENARF